MNSKFVSVIIPCFNAESWIEESLKSVEGQGIDNLEIIVVDDGSNDRSVSIIERCFPHVRVLKTKNRGVSEARNLGTKLSSGEFIQYLDADDLIAKGKLITQLAALESSGADVAYGDWQRLVKTRDGKFEKSEKIIRILKNPEIDLFTDFWCPPAVYLFRRSIVEKIGGWNKKLPVIQDARFALDCALRGGHFVYCEGTMAYYRMHSSGSLSTKDAMAFNRDVLNSAIEVEDWWRNHGGINKEREKTLLKVSGYVARASFEKDNPTFETAYRILERLNPGYIPREPKRLRIASRLFGYRNAEALALWYRRSKSLINRFNNKKHA